jgi:cobyrinic acid a,c-diamide synthase
VESDCGIPVLGVIPKASPGVLLSTRHLGLITPREHAEHESLSRNLLDSVARYLEFDLLLEIARRADPIEIPPVPEPRASTASGLTIGYLTDSAFSFYYPENLEALRAAGAELAPISALASTALPDDLDALYIGGGFPETHAQALSENFGFLASIRHAALAGLPVYAECGGLMLLSRALSWRGVRYPMTGVLPFEVEVSDAPQGHGYSELLVDTANPFFPVGTHLKGHEFHYSRIVPDGGTPPTACAVLRGTGCFARRDAVLAGNVYAAYTHLHALATPEWARGMIGAARAARVAV